MSPWFVVILVVLGVVLTYLLVSITDLVKEEPPPRQRQRRRRPPLEAPAADHVEHAAGVVGDHTRPFAWMDIGSLTGKLTFWSWMLRWWDSGSYMRRRLLASIGSWVLLLAVIGLLLWAIS